MAINGEEVNNDAPDFVKDIKMPSSKMPLDMDFEFTPNNPYTIEGSASSLGESKNIKGISDKPRFLATAGAEAAEFNITYQAAHAGYNELTKVDTADDIHSSDWTPTKDPSMFYNVRPEFINYMMDATGPQDQSYRLHRVMAEQEHSDNLANGSTFAKIIGGIAGIATDPMSYIPIVGWAKYARFAPTIFKTAAKVFPGIATYAVAQSAATQANKINGNMSEFLTDSFINTVTGTVLFSGFGAVGLAFDKLELWNLRGLSKSYVDGIDYKIATDEEGKVTGFKAFSNAPNDNLSAARVNFAQELADSSFQKSGLFKIPYVGDAALKFFSMPVLGTPLPKLLNSPFKTLRGFVDRAMDHSIITKGLEEGKVAPQKFSSLMNQQYASIRMLSAQIDALHLERNGFDLTNRTAIGIVDTSLGLKKKALKALGKDIGNGYVSKDDFHSEVEEVLHTTNPSKHAPVNEAAAMLRETMDQTYSNYRKAYNLPDDWMPPKTAEGYLMRVYDTPYLNAHQNEWTQAISGWLKESDEIINSHLEPINSLKNKIDEAESFHQDLIRRPKITDSQVSKSSKEIAAMRMKKTAMEEKLQNELRENPDLHIHVEDWNALSANEAKELKALTKPIEDLKKQVDEQKEIVASIKKVSYRKERASVKAKTVKTAKKQASLTDMSENDFEIENGKLRDLQNKHDEAEDALQQRIHDGEINPRFYSKIKDSQRYALRDPSERLKFRDTYENHAAREQHAKAYYDTIMNQTPEQTISQVMGKLNGNISENHIKQRTLMIPDDVLYKNNFMSKDLMSKVSNYVTYLSRRTHLKNVYRDVTIDGGIEPLIANLAADHEEMRAPLNEMAGKLKQQLGDLKDKIASDKTSGLEKAEAEKQMAGVEKQIKANDKQFTKTRKEFEEAEDQMKHVFEKMMGLKNMSRKSRQFQSLVMSFTAMANLPFVPFSMINDLSASGLQHGIWPFIRDGVYPMIQSFGGMLKTKDSESLRKTAPAVNLALQDVLKGYADRNWGMYTNPYLNLGRTVESVEKLAHFSSNFTLTNYIDNGLQRIAGTISQSEFMRILHAFKNGSMTEKESLYLRKYGIDPEKWSERMIKSFNEDGGTKTAVGGYQSNFWQWQDMEASEVMSQAIFRSIQNTTINRGLLDSPFWADNMIGSIVHGFNGWTYASINRYVIPSMQKPDAQKLLGVLFMLGTGSLVSPFRRMARGQDPVPDNMTDEQRLWETVQDSGYFSFFSNILADANVFSAGNLLGDLKNDKYRDRTRAGLLGPGWGTANRMFDIISAIGSGEWNEADAKKAARMIPVANASWTWMMSQSLIESLGLPKTRAQAHALKGTE